MAYVPPYIYIYVYVIARVGVKFGINFTSVRLSGNKIARGEAECYLPLNLTRVKFVPQISRLTVLLTLSLPKRCNITPRNVHERFQTLVTPVLTLFTDFLSAVVTSEIAQILSLYGGGFLALKWQS